MPTMKNCTLSHPLRSNTESNFKLPPWGLHTEEVEALWFTNNNQRPSHAHTLRSTMLRYHVTARCGTCGRFSHDCSSRTPQVLKPSSRALRIRNIHVMPQACIHNTDVVATMRKRVRLKEIAKMRNACDFVTQTNATMHTHNEVPTQHTEVPSISRRNWASES